MTGSFADIRAHIEVKVNNAFQALEFAYMYDDSLLKVKLTSHCRWLTDETRPFAAVGVH